MVETKGKGKQNSDKVKSTLADETASQFSHAAGEPSLITRIASSAEGLGRHALSFSDHEVNNSLTAATSSNVKTQNTNRFNSASTGERSIASIPSQQKNSETGLRGLKNNHQEEHVKQSEAAFTEFLDGLESGNNCAKEHPSIIEMHTLEDAWTRSHSYYDHQSKRTIIDQELHDGDDVRALLDDMAVTEEPVFEEGGAESRDFNWGLSKDDLAQLKSITKDLFPPSVHHRSPDPSNPRNLSLSFDTTTRISLMGQSSPSTDKDWMGLWDGVLTGYADEVWGGLLPLVKEARKEVQSTTVEPPNEGGLKALQRLQNILGHLVG